MPIRPHGMPASFGLYMITLGVIILTLSAFIIQISFDVDLWWQVVESIDKSPYFLLYAYAMLLGSFIFIGAGIIILLKKDKNVPD